jgi:hypothetical protein
MGAGMISTQDLMDLWMRLFGEGPAPTVQQFEIWRAKYPDEIVKKGLAITATKNQKLQGQMSLEWRIRYASRVMWTKLHDPQKAAGQRVRPEQTGQQARQEGVQ